MLPTDLNTPVRNPALTAALATNARLDTSNTRRAITRTLMQAVFLVPILTAAVPETPGHAPGHFTWQPGARFSVLLSDDGQGGHRLPLFTDWDVLRQWTDEPVSTLVLPAAEAWDFALADDTYTGVVVNPATDGLVYGRAALTQLAGHSA